MRGARIRVVAAALAAALLAAWGQDDPASRVAALRTQAGAAAQANDLATAQARLTEATRLQPDHPQVLLSLARVASFRGEHPAATEALRRYAALGLALRIDPAGPLAVLVTRPDFAPVQAILTGNARPVGAMAPLARVTGREVLAETVVPHGDAFLIGSVRIAGVFRLTRTGELTPWSTPGTTAGVYGMALDGRGGLWVASAPGNHTAATGGHTRPELILFNLRTSSVARRVTAPEGVAALGDLSVGPDGSVFVSNPRGGGLYRLRPRASTMEPLVAPTLLRSPQGSVVAANGRWLIVADYPTGLWRVDLATGAAQSVRASGVALTGIDGMVRDASALIVAQNGVTPHRILRLTLSPDGRRVTASRVLVANQPELEEPTGGFVRAGRYVFLARSQWSDFEDNGNVRGSIGPLLVAETAAR